MTEQQLETLDEAYLCAVQALDDPGPTSRLERLREAFGYLQQCKPFCAARRKDVYEVKAMLALPRLLAAGERLDAMTEPGLEALARTVRRVQREVNQALTRHARLELDGAQA